MNRWIFHHRTSAELQIIAGKALPRPNFILLAAALHNSQRLKALGCFMQLSCRFVPADLPGAVKPEEIELLKRIEIVRSAKPDTKANFNFPL